MKHKFIVSIVIIFMLGLTQTQTQQVIELPSNQKQAHPQNQQLTIQFKANNQNQPHYIPLKQTHYFISPEITQPYDLVHTHIYPSTNTNNKFVASLPKDNFVQKLIQNKQSSNKHQQTKIQSPAKSQNKQNTQTQGHQKQIKQNKQQKTLQTKENQQNKINKQKQKQAQKRAQQILKKQTIQQQAKAKQQQKIKQQNQQKAHQTINTQDKKTQINTENPVPIKKEQKKEQIKIQDPFSKIETKNYEQLQKTDKTIKFKQHQINKPLQITNYKFQTNINKNQQKKPTPVQTKPTVIQKKEQKINTKHQQSNKQTKIKVDSQKQKQNKIQAQKKLQVQKKSSNQKQKKQPIHSELKKQTNQNLQKQTKKSEIDKTKIKVQDKRSQQVHKPENKFIEEFNQLTKALSVEENEVASQLKFQSMVRQQIQRSDMKFIIAKVIIFIVILIGIYQASCSAQSRQKKVQKGKYAPIGELQTEVQMSQRVEQQK